MTIEQKSEKLYEKFKEKHGKTPKVFKFVKKKGNSTFTISHSAKDVIYDSKRFYERNMDSISGSLVGVLNEKTSSVVQNIYSMKAPGAKIDPNEKAGKQLKGIWPKFSAQIDDLMNELAEPLIPKDLGQEKGPEEIKPKAPAKE